MLLEAIGKIHPSGLQITYAELAPKMIALAQKRNAAGNTVTFINKPVEDAGLQEEFDVVITPFLLDSLSPASFAKVFATLDGLLKPGCLWLNTDFQLSGRCWQKPLLKSMYLFFRLIDCVETTQLPDIAGQFAAYSYRLADKKMFFGDFIATRAYCK